MDKGIPGTPSHTPVAKCCSKMLAAAGQNLAANGQSDFPTPVSLPLQHSGSYIVAVDPADAVLLEFDDAPLAVVVGRPKQVKLREKLSDAP
ncbi:hypothetical protein [Arthrobacter sp. MMS24-S77]